MVLLSDLSAKKQVRFLKVELIGAASNRDGLGARVEVRAGAQTYTMVYDGKSGYLAQSHMPLYFGLDRAETVDRVVVDWPSGKRQTLSGPIAANQLLQIREP